MAPPPAASAAENGAASRPPATSIGELPPELMLAIFSHLDRPALSSLNLHQQPRAKFLARPHGADLKAISCVSKAFRALTLPLLFSHVLWKPSISSLSAFSLNPIPLLRFLEDNMLGRTVTTFTMLVEFVDWAADVENRTPHIRPVDLEWLWDQLFSVLDPLRFTLIAPPATLAAFLSRMLFLEDSWSFGFEHHILSLSRTSRDPVAQGASDSDKATLLHSKDPVSATSDSGTSFIPDNLNATAAASSSSSNCRKKKAPPCPLFTIRPWTSLLLNEGSFINVYKTYEFFQRQPPSMLGALLGGEEYPNNEPMIPPSVVDFSYVAIFPLWQHMTTIVHHMPRLDRLFVQLAPTPENSVLEDQYEMAQVDRSDLWQERNSAYSAIMRELSSFNGEPEEPGERALARGQAQRHWEALRVFESGDPIDQGAWDWAVDFLKESGVKKWKVEREGVFVRVPVEEQETQAPDGSTQQPSHSALADGGVGNPWNHFLSVQTPGNLPPGDT